VDRFANTVAGGAAALAGLLFVGLSLNLSEVLEYPGVPSRAAATLGLTVAILLIAIFVATPEQGRQALSIEIAVIGVATAAMVLVAMRHLRAGPNRAKVLTSMLMLMLPAVLFLVAATANAWVLVVELKR
jgi:modulator of FtsH protease